MHGKLRSSILLIVLAGILAATGGQNLCLALRTGGMDCCKAAPCHSTGIKAADCCRFSPAAPAQSPAAVAESTALQSLRVAAKSFLGTADAFAGSVPGPELIATLVSPGEIDSGPFLVRYLLNSSLRR